MRLLYKDQNPIKFIKKDGSVYNISGNIQSDVNKMITASVDMQFETGDYLERELPNKLIEKYIILRVNYSRNFVNMDIQNIADISSATTTQTPVLNIGEVKGNINVNSVVNDYSTNCYTEANEAFFNDLKEIMANTNDEILKAIDEMQINVGKKTFVEKYNNFIQMAASYMTLVAPFLPALGDCLQQVLK